MTTRLSNHVKKHGVLPEIEIVNWGTYITFRLKFGDHETTSFIYPADNESTGEYITRIRGKFADVDVTVVEDPSSYA